MKSLIVVFAVMMSTVLLSGCEGKFEPDVAIQVVPSAKIQQYSKVIVVGVSPRLDVRQMEERYICSSLKGVECIQSLSFLSFGLKDKLLNKAVEKMVDTSANGILLVTADMRSNQYSEMKEEDSGGLKDGFFLSFTTKLIDSDGNVAVHTLASTRNRHKDYQKTLHACIDKSLDALRNKGFLKK